MLPKTRALNTGTGSTWAVSGALNKSVIAELSVHELYTYRLLEHATANTRPTLPNFLNLSASRSGKSPAHLGFGRFGRVAKFIYKSLGLRIWVHRNRTREGGGALRRSSKRRVVFLKTFEQELFMGGKLLVPRRHPRQAIGETRTRILLHRQPLWDHLVG